MKIAIIGYGVVGKAMHKLFPSAVVYDKHLKIGSVNDVDNSDISFICVPTPEGNGGKCDTSIIENILSKLSSKLFIIRSTVYIGFTDWASTKFKANIVFQPEYYGETINHPFTNLSKRNWITFGGHQNNIDKAINAYKLAVNSNIKIVMGPAKEIELAKYMENAFLALKVTFCNEMYQLSQKMNLNYNIAREAWISDPRIGASHTFVYQKKMGYGGKCLPKDVSNLIFQANEKKSDVSLLEAMVKKNDIIKGYQE